jgi:hypothetical protein
LLAGTLLGSCRKPAPTDGSLATIVASPKHDFGRVAQGDTLYHVFLTHNGTSTSIAVENTREVLGCAGVAAPATLAANQSGELRVTCRANVPGPLRVSLPLRANGRPAGELSLAAEVEPRLAFDRALLEMNVPFGRTREAGARLRGKLARSARLTLASAAPSGMDVEVLPSVGGETEGAMLRLKSAVVGVHAGTLRFDTGLTDPAAIELPYSVRVTGTLAVSPTNPVLDLAAASGPRTLVTVTSTQPGFRVERAEVVEGPFSARVQKARDGYVVEVSVVVAKFPAGSHGANGRLRILSNDRTEPNKELPLFALGKPRSSLR